jgi:hypothetical protein
LIEVAVLAADIQDRDAAVELFDVIQTTHPHLQCIWADGQYQGGLGTTSPATTRGAW